MTDRSELTWRSALKPEVVVFGSEKVNGKISPKIQLYLTRLSDDENMMNDDDDVIDSHVTCSVDDVTGFDVTSVVLDDVTGNTLVVFTDGVIGCDDDVSDNVVTCCDDVTVVCVATVVNELVSDNNSSSSAENLKTVALAVPKIFHGV